MNFKIVKFDEISSDRWDQWVQTLPASTYLHSSFFLGFLHRLVPLKNRLTFACTADEGFLLALVPLGISKACVGGEEFFEASWNGAAMGAPVFCESTPRIRRKIWNAVFKHLHCLLQERNVKRVLMRVHPLSLQALSGGYPFGQFELMSQGYVCHPQNTIVIDLRKSEETLVQELSPYQRKHIRQTVKKGLMVREHRGKDQEVKSAFQAYQAAHIQSAGRMTRPPESFDWMMKLVQENQASLFVEYLKETPISFLYCGEFYSMAFGWSQVNVEGYEREYSPRHNLEWQAVLTYKRRGFRFYEVGTRWFGSQPHFVPSEKELTIAEFKERYGGILMGDLTFEYFLDKELKRSIDGLRCERYLEVSDHEHAELGGTIYGEKNGDSVSKD